MKYPTTVDISYSSVLDRFESFDGIQLSYQVVGDDSRTPVLLLHGFAADSERNWFGPGVVEALVAAGKQVVALDARGHGRSEKPHDPDRYADDAMVRDVGALLDHLGLDEVHVCGYSMGAMTTYALVADDERARSAVLGGVGARLGTRALAESAPRIAAGLLTDDPADIVDPTARAFRAFADATGADRDALAAIQQSRSRLWGDRRPIDVPTLIIAGDSDRLVGSPYELAARVPGATVKLVSGDHLSAVFDPAFRQAIVDFVTGIDHAD